LLFAAALVSTSIKLLWRLPKSWKEPACGSGKQKINSRDTADGKLTEIISRDHLLRGEASYAARGFNGNLAAKSAGVGGEYTGSGAGG
jgi:hypothetical protein